VLTEQGLDPEHDQVHQRETMETMVVWNMNFMTFHSVGNVIIPTDELICFKLVKTANKLLFFTYFSTTQGPQGEAPRPREGCAQCRALRNLPKTDGKPKKGYAGGRQGGIDR